MSGRLERSRPPPSRATDAVAGTWIDQHGLRKRLEGLPLILCGPILGRTEPGSVTVWVALKAKMTVTLRVYTRFDPDAQGTLTERAIGTRGTVRLGESLHIVAVTATPTGEPLVAGQLYFYDLFFSASPALPVPETAEALRSAGIAEPLSGTTLDDLQPSNLSYSQELRLPSFSLPPSELNKLRLVNGSCRKPHGGEEADAFPGLDDMQAVDWPVADERPHQLVLTGDQIYADGIPPVTLFMVMDVERTLLGWDEPEPLPGVKPADDLRPGARKRVVKEIAGLTTGGHESHPLRLAEYLGIHLFAWSDVLWPEQLPQLHDLLETLTPSGSPRPEGGPPPQDALPEDVREAISAGFEANQRKLEAFRGTLKRARRALANVPTYMMLDDHDVTDDWNMYRDWANRVYSKELGRRVIQNGSTAYALCQAWGSLSDRFTDNTPGGALLQAVQAWAASGGTDAGAHAEIARRVAIPPVTSTPDGTVTGGLFKTVEDGKALERPPGALDWHYTVSGPKHEVLALDSRTRRSFPSGKLDSPAQIGSAALREQIDVGQDRSDAVTLVIAPTNLLTVPFFYGSRFFGSSPTISLQLIILAALRDIVFEARQLWRRLWGEEVAYHPDLSDSWSPQSAAFEAVISRLARRASASDSRRRMRVVVLSGDVHFSWAGRMRYWADRPFQEEEAGPSTPIDATFAFLTSSAFKADSNTISRLVHPYGYVPVLDELPPPARWFGWRKPITVSAGGAGGLTDFDVDHLADWLLFQPSLLRRTPAMLATGEESLLASAPPTPDWRYRIDFMLGDMSSRAQAALTKLATPPPDARDEWLKVFSEALRRHRDYARKWGDGLEMIGKNNLAVLRFHWEGDTELAAGISESDTSLRLADSSGFPDAPFRMIIDAETLAVGAIDRVTHVCSELKRAAFETTAQAHLTGAGVRTAKAVVQTHWWRLTDELGLLPLTTYVVSLEHEDARYPRPKLPGEADS